MRNLLCAALSLLSAGCATATGINDFSGGVAWTPTPDLSAERVTLADAECPRAAANAETPSVSEDYLSTYPYGGVGAALGLVIGEAINQSRADEAARNRAIVTCYISRGFVPLELTSEERRHWQSLETVESRRSFTTMLISNDPTRIDDKWLNRRTEESEPTGEAAMNDGSFGEPGSAEP